MRGKQKENPPEYHNVIGDIQYTCASKSKWSNDFSYLIGLLKSRTVRNCTYFYQINFLKSGENQKITIRLWLKMTFKIFKSRHLHMDTKIYWISSAKLCTLESNM